MSSSELSNVIKKANLLVDANYRLPLNEQRILHAITVQLRMEDTKLERYRINLAELAALHRVENSRSFYSDIHRAAERLLSEQVDLSEGRRKIKTNFLTYVEYVEGEAELIVEFHKVLKPYLLQLKENFTQYLYKYVVRFKGSYSLRFYEFLKRRQNQGGGGEFYIEFTVELLRARLKIAVNEYPKFKDLRVRVIEPALKEIQEQTDLEIVSTEYIKKGRAIHAVKIIARPKPEIIETPKTRTVKKIKPLRVKFSGVELVKFNELKLKHPTLTESEIWDLAEKHKMDPFMLMVKMLSSDADDFGLELTD